MTELLSREYLHGLIRARIDLDGALPLHDPSLGQCWEWEGTRGRYGYGRIGIGGRQNRRDVFAHRLVYEVLIGPIEDGLELDHLCRNQSCVNPNHLEPVSHQINHRRWSDSITHCGKGHEYTPENTYRYPKTGHRKCKTCRDENKRAWERSKPA